MTNDDSSSGYQVRGRVWIDGPEGTFLGFGRVTLLERIQEHGSISAAARSMEMSYRHAWQLVDSINRQAPEPIVEMKTGGRGGGGAELTPAGEHVIMTFWMVHNRLGVFLERQSHLLNLQPTPSESS